MNLVLVSVDWYSNEKSDLLRNETNHVHTHLELFFSFFPFLSLNVFLCKVFCVSYFPNSWGIFFLGRDTRLCLIQYEILSMRNFWMQKREKPLELVVCEYVCVYERIYRNVNLIWGWRIGFVFSFIIVY